MTTDQQRSSCSASRRKQQELKPQREQQQRRRRGPNVNDDPYEQEKHAFEDIDDNDFVCEDDGNVVRNAEEQGNDGDHDDDEKLQDDDYSDPLLLTIRSMEREPHLCLHPKHGHSFQQINCMLFSILDRKFCAGCEERLQSVVVGSGMFGSMGGGDPSRQLVKCVACGAVSHRSCAIMMNDSKATWKTKCPVNVQRIANSTTTSVQEVDADDDGPMTSSTVLVEEDTTTSTRTPEEPKSQQVIRRDVAYRDTIEAEVGWTDTEPSPSPPSAMRNNKKDGSSSFMTTGSSSSAADHDDAVVVDEDDDDDPTGGASAAGTDPGVATMMLWTSNGPPQHWADPYSSSSSNQKQSIQAMIPTIALPAECTTTTTAVEDKTTKKRSNSNDKENRDGEFPTRSDKSFNTKGHGPNKAMETAAEEDDDDDDQVVNVSPLHYANHPFASVSRALQENIQAHFRRKSGNGGQHSNGSGNSGADEGASTAMKEVPASASSFSSSQQPPTELPTTKELDLGESFIATPPSGGNSNPLANFATGTMEAVKSTVKIVPPRVGAAAVAGGIAGGMAGLVMAGPAGAYAGYKVGQMAGALGVILEGSVTIGVVVAGVATGARTAQHIHDQIDENGRRVLTMGEDGTSRKVLLVRPNVNIDDDVWDRICAEAKRTSSSDGGNSGDGGSDRGGNGRNGVGLSSLLSGVGGGGCRIKKDSDPSSSSSSLNKARYRRESDITKTQEDEIPTQDKIFLLVSRMLNDKFSVPGHVYRYLIRAFKDRCEARRKREKENADLVITNPMTTKGYDNNEDETAQDPSLSSSRVRRDDAQAVIKHVTATLLESRPWLGSSSTLIELTATAVEMLVFGQIYDLVFEEIAWETAAKEASLRSKIESSIQHFSTTSSVTSVGGVTTPAPSSTEASTSSSWHSRGTAEVAPTPNSEDGRRLPPQEWVHDPKNISEPALTALRMLPEAHSVAEKLRYCVEFLERLAEHFDNSASGGTCTADSLLKLVCQHIIRVVPDDFFGCGNIYGQVAFLEEFARDEQLLRGREGYSLVTLQASLHFLHMSGNDLQRDIFGQDDTEENVPVAAGAGAVGVSKSY